MKRGRAKGEFDSLHSIFADMCANGRADPIERIVVLTYEFDDQQLVNLLASRALDDDIALRTNELRFIASCQPVVLYDARKTREFNQLPHFLDLIPVRAAAYSCHHSKAYLIVTRHTVRLVLGSFNLTQSGLFSNREVVMAFTWSEQEREHRSLLRSFTQLLRDGYANHSQAASSDALANVVETVGARMEAWSGGREQPSDYVLLASGYGEGAERTGLAKLGQLWRAISDQPPTRLVAISPFFDRGRSYLVDALNRELGTIGEIGLYTDAATFDCLSKRHYGAGAHTRRLHLLPKALGAPELARIAAANDNARLADVCIERKLHAKILILCGPDNRHLVYIGSANFTLKAWNGDNHELGLAWTETGNADRFIAGVLRALAPAESCSFDGLPDLLDDCSNDDALYQDAAGYPDFVESIELQRDSEGNVRFHFRCAAPERLLGYAISWDTMQIQPAGAVSQALAWDACAMPLLGKHNLRFVAHGSEQSAFYLPFHHAPELLVMADLALFPSAEDWLRHYMHAPGAGGSGPGEKIPRDCEDDPPPAGVDREANTVIAMQRYLTLFGAVETVFHARIGEIAASPDSAAQWQRRVVEPLELYARLLEKDVARGAAAEEQQAFKVGELALFCHSLRAQVPGLDPLVKRLAKVLRPRAAQPAVLKNYLNYCVEQLAS